LKVAVDDPTHVGETPANQDETRQHLLRVGGPAMRGKRTINPVSYKIRHALHIWFTIASAFVLVSGLPLR
jgi:hypothetical protein